MPTKGFFLGCLELVDIVDDFLFEKKAHSHHIHMKITHLVKFLPREGGTGLGTRVNLILHCMGPS